MELQYAKAWLDFVSTLIWQIIIVSLFACFRKEVRELVVRVGKFSFAGAELEFQNPSENAPKSSAEAIAVALLVKPDEFCTNAGVDSLVEGSDLVDKGERVRRKLLIFSTQKQHTWLVATDRQLFCVLDDAQTRTSGRLIQWHMPLESVDTIKTKPYKESVGLVDVGGKKNWLYSLNLYPEHLEDAIRLMVDEAKRERT